MTARVRVTATASNLGAVGAARLAAWREIGIEAELIRCTTTVAGATVTASPRTAHREPTPTHPVSPELS